MLFKQIRPFRFGKLLPIVLLSISFSFFTSCEQQTIDSSPELSAELTTAIESIAATTHDEYDEIPIVDIESRNDLSITEYLSFKPNLSILAEAISRVPDLAETLSDPSIQITLLAPNNEAFNDFLEDSGFDSLDDIPVNTLGMVLMNHVLSREGRVGVVELESEENTLVEGQTSLSIEVTGQETATINEEIEIVKANQFVSRSIVHIIDGVIVSSDDTEENNDNLIIKKEEASVDAVFDAIVQRIEAQDALMIAAQIDHAANAANVGLELRPTKTVIFGNPAAGTQFMQSDQRIGIDLPLKFVVWEDESGTTNVAYYNATTLTQRYSIEDKEEVVNMVNMALNNLSGGGTLQMPENTEDITNKMIVKESPNNIDTTYNRLIRAIDSKPPINIMAEVPHDKAAANVGLELRPTRLVIFGNPNVGTKFMQSNQRMGIDLPLKMLIWEEENGKVFVGYYNATTLTERYDVEDQEEAENMVNMVLDGLSDAAVAE